MADYKKVIEILADTKSAESSLKSLVNFFDKSAKSFAKALPDTLADSLGDLQPKVKAYFDAIRTKAGADAFGFTPAIEKATEAVTAARDALMSDETGRAFLARIDEINNAAKDAEADAAAIAAKSAADAAKSAAESDLFAFAGTSSDMSRINELRKELTSLSTLGTAKTGLSVDTIVAANVALTVEENKLKQITLLKAKYNALSLIDNKNTKEKEAILKKIAQLEGKQYKAPGFKGDMRTALSNLNPFNKERLDKFKENGKYDTVAGAAVGKLANRFVDTMLNGIKKIGSFFITTFKESFDKLAKMATYDAGTTLLSDAKNRERQLTFGLTGAQNYAMANAMGILNMQSIEDLMWGNAAQKEMFANITSTLEAQYAKLEASGIFTTVQQFQVDMALMKMQFQNTIYEFIAAHKTQLETLLNVALSFMEQVLAFLGWMADGLSAIFGQSQYAGIDALSAASTTTNTTNTDNSRQINLNIDYTNNQGGAGSESAISSGLINQLITILNG